MDGLKSQAKVFKALCDVKRLEILEHLRGGEKCACELLETMELVQSGLSYHMKILCDSGIVTGRQEGKWTYYTLCKEGQQKAINLLLEITTPTNSEKKTRCVECGG